MRIIENKSCQIPCTQVPYCITEQPIDSIIHVCSNGASSECVCVAVHRAETPAKTGLLFFFHPEDSRLAGEGENSNTDSLLFKLHQGPLHFIQYSRFDHIEFLKQSVFL